MKGENEQPEVRNKKRSIEDSDNSSSKATDDEKKDGTTSATSTSITTTLTNEEECNDGKIPRVKRKKREEGQGGETTVTGNDDDADNGNEPKDVPRQANSDLKGREHQQNNDGDVSSKEDESDKVNKKNNEGVSEQEPITENRNGNVDTVLEDDKPATTNKYASTETETETGIVDTQQKGADVNVDGDGDGKEIKPEAETNDNIPTMPSKNASKFPVKNGEITKPSPSDTKDKKGNPYDSLKYIMVQNDGKPESLIKLVALKSLFSRQLPKMPRTYIARLVFDRRHTSLVILNDDPATKDTDEEVIGSICYRAFPGMRFAEIAFCAVNASHQVKGYGTKLMNLVKQEGVRTGIEYFITYADNYAIGYFKKQGFTKNISMPKGRYQGLIKDYDGGTMMECYVHPSIDFTRIPEMLAAQRKFILSRIRLKARSHKVVYDPLPKSFNPLIEGVSRANESAARALAVPGMVEAGWKLHDLISTTGQQKDLDRVKNALKSELLSMIRKVEEQQFSWPFREPVDTNEVKDYLDVIKQPIDLLTIDRRIHKGDYYKSRKMLYADLILMVNNCKLYNEEASTYVQCAANLEKYLKVLFFNSI